MKALEKKFGAPPISESDVSGGGLKGAARDILEAIRDNDAGALASALKLAYGHCSDESMDGDEEDEDDEE
jgi:hypothetical protein